jgi:hypothetical protein
VESIVVQVLILKELEDGGVYKMVTRERRKILRDFEGPRGGGA